MFDDLKKIAGTHTGAAPNLRMKMTQTIAPIVVSHPLAPVQRPPAPAPAPMPKLSSTASSPPHLVALPKGMTQTIASTFGLKPKPSNTAKLPAAPPGGTFRSPPPPTLSVSHPDVPSHAELAATSPALASLAAAAGIVALSPSLPSSLQSMTSTSTSATAPSGSQLVDRGARAPRTSTTQSLAAAGSDARGYERVERSARPKNAQGMPPSGSNEMRGGTTKGASIMGYKGTGEITYCPINSAGNVAANSQAQLPGVRPSKPFQGQQLLIDPSLWAVFTIVDIKLGNEPVAVATGAVSAGNFPPQNGAHYEWKVADGVDINVTVANVTATATPFSALLRGEICEKTA